MKKILVSFFCFFLAVFAAVNGGPALAPVPFQEVVYRQESATFAVDAAGEPFLEGYGDVLVFRTVFHSGGEEEGEYSFLVAFHAPEKRDLYLETAL